MNFYPYLLLIIKYFRQDHENLRIDHEEFKEKMNEEINRIDLDIQVLRDDFEDFRVYTKKRFGEHEDRMAEIDITILNNFNHLEAKFYLESLINRMREKELKDA